LFLEDSPWNTHDYKENISLTEGEFNDVMKQGNMENIERSVWRKFK
jgi:hypothetical protein